MIRAVLGILITASLSASVAIGQGANAVLSGTIVDPSGAALVDVQLTLENTQTGLGLKTSSNEAGVYQFRSIQPGRYRLTAERQDFQTVIYPDLLLEVSAQMDLPLSMKLAQITNAVEIAADLRLATSTASVGTLIQDQQVRDLPISERDVLRLVDTQPGITKSDSNNGTNYNLSGARRNAVNVTADGFPVKDQIGNNGVSSVIYLSPDLIEQVRIVTSPADAELGRGSGQVQVSTRSGQNAFHGSVFESHRNTSLNANTFFNNQRGDPRDFLIRNQFGGRLGGPIVKNKTFFHFLYDGQREVTKTPTTPLVYTETARQGIFRFFPGVVNGNFNAAVPTVDINGNPVKPSTATGDLQSISVFGRDPARMVPDPTGIVPEMMSFSPLPNNFRFGDGLNTAGYTWSRRATADRDQFNTRIDHQLTPAHRLNFSWTHQRTRELNAVSPQSFPDTPGGSNVSKTNVFAFRVTSALSSQVLNEFQIGSQNGNLRGYAAWEGDGQSWLPVADGIGYKTTFTGNLSNIFLPMSFPSGSVSLLNLIGDSVSWVSGRHAFKFGGEYRWGGGPEAFVDIGVTPTAMFGAGNPPVTGLAPANVPGIGGNQATAQNLLINLSGSLAQVNQRFYATGGPNYEAIPEGQHADGDILQREFSLFFKDDWKLRPDLTLNLGVRYEYYGVPWLEDTKTGRGTTAAVIGGSSGVYGISGTSFADLYRPGHLAGTMTSVEYVGPNSPNPGRNLFNKDWNNFAPAVGLSWSIPYFGAERTVLRMGYGIGYERIPLFVVGNTVGLMPGTVAPTVLTSPQYLDLSRVHLPLTPLGVPLDTVPLTDRNTAIGVYDSNIRTGYVQNWNLSVQRQLPGKFTLDVRYVGSKGTKLVRQIDINEVNIFESGIRDAFVVTQAGGNAPLLDQIFNGLDLGLGVVNGTTVTGSQSVRSNTNTRAFFANNNVGAFASFLNSTPLLSGTNVRGDLLRRAGLPENLIVGNPQFGAARIAGNFANSTYHALQIELNKQFSDGLILQNSYTWGRTIGEHAGNSHALIDIFYRDGRNRHLDKRLLPFHRTHSFKTNGIYELPFGPGKPFLGYSNDFVSRLVERWQFGGIVNLVSGQPITITNQTSSFNQYTTNNTANLVGPMQKDFGKVTRDAIGVLYFPGLKIVRDPAATALTSQQNLNQASLMQALADAQDNLIAVNPAPGTVGSMSPGYLEGPGQFRLDVNLIKRIRIGEGKELEFRADAVNVLNRTNFANPDTDINSPNFGRITETSGENRLIILSGRFSF
ncbi:MAG TPA: TonB-dependent receptor [Terriglobia bacterium]|nr:TonB-dependent receptor [Terriglobia bacterium]